MWPSSADHDRQMEERGSDCNKFWGKAKGPQLYDSEILLLFCMSRLGRRRRDRNKN